MFFLDFSQKISYCFSPSWYRNCSNPKIKGAIVFHEQGPQSYDYSIRLNHSWAFSGFPDVKSIMDTNGPYLDDLELGVNTLPILQYSFSGFLTVFIFSVSFLIFHLCNYVYSWRWILRISYIGAQSILIICWARDGEELLTIGLSMGCVRCNFLLGSC